MGIQIKGSNDTISAADGSMVLEGAALTFTNENITGVSTMGTAVVTSGDLTVGVSTLFVDNSTGRIGVGTAVPAGKHLTVGPLQETGTDRAALAVKTVANSLNNGEAAILIEEASGTEGYYLGVDSSGGLSFTNSGTSYQTLYLRDNDSVGLGTNSPAQKFHIRAGSGTVRVQSTDDATSARIEIVGADNSYAGLHMGDVDDVDEGGFRYYNSDKFLLVRTNGAERLRINSTGDVNITGVTTATAYSTSSGQQIANRNVVHNGDMNINQRANTTQVTIQYSGYYTVDRWKYSSAGGSGTWTMVQDTDVPDGQGFNHSLKTDCQVANASPDADDYVLLTQSMEGLNLQRFNKGTSDAKTMTLSFWAKSTLTGNFVAELNDNDNSRTVSALFQTTTSWKKHVITFPADTTGAFSDDNGASLYLNFWLSAGSDFTSGTLATTWASNTAANRAAGVQNLMSSTSNNFWITGVQLEAGSVATPFEFRDHGDQLSTCQRYFQKLPVSSDHVMWGFGRAESNSARVQIPLNVPLRATPSITCSNFRTVKYDGTMLQSTTTPTVFKWDAVFPGIILDFPSGGTQTHNNVYIVTSDGGSTGLQISSEL